MRAISILLYSMLMSVLPPANMGPETHAERVSFPPWTPSHLARNGFRRFQEGSQAHVTIARQRLRLALDADAACTTPVAARLTELAPGQPRRWQPTIDRPILLSAQVRFDQVQSPQHLTETIFFWSGLTPPISAIGVTRDHGMYAAIVVVNFDPATGAGVFQRTPMPSTVRADAWHTITIVIAADRATITVADQPVLDVTLPELPPPLAVELSVDNDNIPEGHLPVITPDALSIRTLIMTQR
jgi:hypothetical protein